MKIALCLSGQPRSFEKGYEYHKKNLLDQYNVDVFIHTWESDDSKKYVDLYEPEEYIIEKHLMMPLATFQMINLISFLLMVCILMNK